MGCDMRALLWKRQGWHEEPIFSLWTCLIAICQPTASALFNWFILGLLHPECHRWAGVPFVLKAGKALNERKAEIRVQLRSTPHFVFNGEPEAMRNEVGWGQGVVGWPVSKARGLRCLLPPIGQCFLLCLQLVVRLQPDEAIYLKLIVKKPGQ